MSNAIEIDGKIFSSIKDVTGTVSYSRDYITRLAREKKIKASYIGRQWFVDVDSLKNYAETSAFELEVRKKQLSEERKKEREVREVTETQNTLHLRKARSLRGRSMAVSSLVLGFGILGGLAVDFLTTTPTVSFAQLASTQDSQVVDINPGIIPQYEDTVSVATSLLEPRFEPNINHIQDGANGILLLPSVDSGTLGVTAAEMFSDDVVVKTSDAGEQVLVRIDENGNQVGREITFVIVPVTNTLR